ncbi:MAG: glycosyltransferase [Gemmatimonadota bacterium]
MTKTIALIALGSRGDVQPILALAAGLRDVGHSVRIATHESLRHYVERHGFAFRLVRPDLGGMLQEPRVRDSMERGTFDMIVKFRAMMQEIRPQLDGMANDMFDACLGADLIVHPKVYGSACHYIARGLGVPSVAFGLQPADPTGDFATLALPPRTHLGRRMNAWSHALAINALAWQPFRASTNAMLQRRLPTIRATRAGPFAEMQRHEIPMLYAFSEHVVPRPTDWSDALHLTGYWWFDDAGWRPPDELTRFLEAGPPPVYVGFGSMPSGSPRITRVVLDALRGSGQRGILAGRWEGIPDSERACVFLADDVPHRWLFPRTAAVVHHSGAGTTAAALRAGVPSINVPFFVDQPFWGERVRALGVGPNPIPMRHLNADRLAMAIKQAVSGSAMRDRCVALSERLASDRGVARAVEVIEAALT